MTKKKSQPKPTTSLVPIPTESEDRKQQRLEEEFWKEFDTANSKYWNACNVAWRKYETALKADLEENPKRNVRMRYDDQYDIDISLAIADWRTYFDY